MQNLEQHILWARIDLPGYDTCNLWAAENSWRLEGTAIFAHEGQPVRLDYSVVCDTNWQTRSANISGWIGRQRLDLAINASTHGGWDFNGIAQPQTAGCLDVDLGFTPATNLIPIRRLSLAAGQAADAPAAYLAFPSLKLERLAQHYHRIDPNTYAYESPGVGYSANLETSEIGFVTRYPGLWEMAAMQ